MRIYNPGLGKFLSVDPIASAFPYYTPFQFAANKPIVAIDMDGLEDVYVTTEKGNRTMSVKYEAEDINNIVAGNCAKPRIHYNEGAAVSQFEGPNKKNEDIVFRSFQTEHENVIKKQYAKDAAEGNTFVKWGRTNPIKIPDPAKPKPHKIKIPSSLEVEFVGGKSDFVDENDVKNDIVEIGKYLKSNPKASLVLTGNTGDSHGALKTGSTPDVLAQTFVVGGKTKTLGALMKERAEAVKQLIIKEYGVNPGRIQTQEGSYQNDDSNRRVDVKIK